ncbi:MAG: hypothetical protein AAF196_19545, partial [Planctomycetota bacterium]
MFRRSLVAFLTVSFAVLAMVLGYALIGLSGPESTLAEAQQALKESRPVRALQLADRAWDALGPNSDPALRRAVLATRRQAHELTANAQLVLLDIQKQRQLEPDRQDLAVDELRWTLIIGETEAGYSRAKTLLADDPDNPALLELTGEAAQLLYQDRISDLINRLNDQLPRIVRPNAFAALRAWLYSPEGSLSAAAGRRQLAALLEDKAKRQFYNSEWQETARSVRVLIDEAQLLYRRSLEAGGDPVAAYQGLAYALREAGRHDDLEWHAEAYLRRYDHEFTTDAAADLAELYFDSGRLRAVLAVEQRFLGDTDPVQRALDDGFSARLPDLLIASARARFEIGDKEGLTRQLDLCTRLVSEANVDLGPYYDWIVAMEILANERGSGLGPALSNARRGLRLMNQTPKVRDQLIAITALNLDVAVEKDWAIEAVSNFTTLLVSLQPEDPTPLLRSSERRVSENDISGALREVQRATRLENTNEQAKRLLADIINERSIRNGAGGAERAYRRAVELGGVPPATPVEILPLAAELALERRSFRVARKLADQAAATDAFWLWPREIAARADILLGERESANRRIREVLAVRADDDDALEMLRNLRRTAGIPIDDLVRDLLVAGQTDPAIGERLLELAIAREDQELAHHVARGLATRQADDARALLMLGRVEKDAGNLQTAADLFGRALEVATLADSSAYQESLVELVLASAELRRPTDDLQKDLGLCLQANYENTDVLVQLATELLGFNRPILAYLAIQPVLDLNIHREARNGEHFLLGGRIALRNANFDRAVDHFRQAMTFPETDLEGQRDLALLYWGREEPENAIRTWTEHEVVDLPTAAHAAAVARRFRVGNEEGTVPPRALRAEDAAISWVRLARQSAPLDPGLMALQALIAEVELGAPGSPAVRLARRHPDELLRCLLFLDTEHFGREGVVSTRALLEVSAPTGEDPVQDGAHAFARLLHARALTNFGQPAAGYSALLSLIDDQPLMPEPYEEALRALETTGATPTLDSALLSRFRRPEVQAVGLATPRLTELLARQLAASLIATSRADRQTLRNLADRWIGDPKGTGASLSEVRLLINTGESEKALALCKRLESELDSELEAEFLDTLFLLYDYEIKRLKRAGLDKAADDLREDAIDESRIRLRNIGARGVLVNFQIDRMVLQAGPISSWVDP